jgi:hypothetical protein
MRITFENFLIQIFLEQKEDIWKKISQSIHFIIFCPLY